jgi:3-methylcrotonyl-CoA carboxylase alpha subunit
MRSAFTIADQDHELWLARTADGYRLHGLDRALPVALEAGEGGTQLFRIGNTRYEAVVAVDGDLVHIHLDGAAWTVRYHDPVERHGHHHGASADDVAQAPMPGTAIAVHVAEGQAVARGDTLVVIESMKLETAIKAWRDGTVASVHVAAGQAFDRGTPLVTLAAEA